MFSKTPGLETKERPTVVGDKLHKFHSNKPDQKLSKTKSTKTKTSKDSDTERSRQENGINTGPRTVVLSGRRLNGNHCDNVDMGNTPII